MLGGDHAPAATTAGALLAVEADPDLHLTLVGPAELAAGVVGRGPADRLGVAAASEVIGMAEDAARAVRRRPDATVRVAARLVRDGEADAAVSVGSTGAALAAALFALPRLPGVHRPGLAVTVPARERPVVLLDVGATVECTVSMLEAYALAGAAYARAVLGVAEPSVGLLSVGTEPGKGDPLRRAAHDALAALPLRFAGNVEGGEVVTGARADVVVCDGFTGNVVLKALEAALPAGQGREQGGAVLLGLDGVVVVGHGGASAAGVAACVAAAAGAVRDGVVPRLRSTLAELVARRRAIAREVDG